MLFSLLYVENIVDYRVREMHKHKWKSNFCVVQLAQIIENKISDCNYADDRQNYITIRPGDHSPT